MSLKISPNSGDKFEYWDLIDHATILLNNSLYNSEERVRIEAKIDHMSEEELEGLILHLRLNQIDPINAGHNYQMGDILRKLKREL